MTVSAAFMVPHPPLIIPEVGRGGEKQILETTNAYEKVAEEVAAIKPDTIIITSPHSVMYADYFHISPGHRATGSFADFGASGVRFSEEYDTELADAIALLAEKENFPAGTMGERESSLDHGTMVPLWFIRKKYTGGKIVRIGLSGLPLTYHYRLGQIIAKAVDDSGKKVVIIASGDLSHKLQEYGPYGYSKEGPEYDEKIMEVCGKAEFGRLFEFDESLCQLAAECGHRSFVIMAGAFDGLSVKATALSHQDVTGVGYGICTFYPGGADESRHFLQDYEKKLEKECKEKADANDEYVKLARASVESWVKEHRQIQVPDGLSEELLTRAAGTFVSIHKMGQLRGCIGTIEPARRCVAEEIIENAISASSRDPRFSPVREDELDSLEISVDVLAAPEKISSFFISALSSPSVSTRAAIMATAAFVSALFRYAHRQTSWEAVRRGRRC